VEFFARWNSSNNKERAMKSIKHIISYYKMATLIKGEKNET
jgi:hypothetical protein